jgi:peptide/nickel transport system permease protein
VFGYIVRRLIAAFLVVFVTSIFVFALFSYGPTNPASFFCSSNGRCTEQRQALIEHQLGLDQSFTTQYTRFVKGLFVDRKIKMGAVYNCPAPCLGISYVDQQPVREEIISKYPATLSLAIGGAAIYVTLGVFMGSLAARWRGSVADKGLVTGSLVVSSFPYYVVCLLAWIYLYLIWDIFPKPGYVPFHEDPVGWASGLLLPWLVLGVTSSTAYARYSRASMIDSLGEDYVRSATAKGVSTNKAVFKHALRAAIVPVVTIFGIDFAFLLSGTVFTEKIFQIDGVGNLAISAIPNDFPVIAATVLMAAVLIVIANLLVDILYSVLDPRVRLV